MSKIHIHNDQKDKHQSFEANIEDSENAYYGMLTGYGPNAQKATDDLLKNIAAEIAYLQQFIPNE